MIDYAGLKRLIRFDRRDHFAVRFLPPIRICL